VPEEEEGLEKAIEKQRIRVGYPACISDDHSRFRIE